MRIATWNVNSIRARLDRALDWLDDRQPDVVCLQEIKCLDEQFPRAAFEARGYHVETYGQKTYNGVAILSRTPPTEVFRRIPWEDDEQARGIACRIDDVLIVDLYVVNGKQVGDPKYTYKLEWLDRLMDWLDAHTSPDDLLCVCGDYNIAPDDIDVHDPVAWHERILCSTPERERFQRLLDWGLVDSFRQFDDRPGQYSWWDMRTRGFERGQGLRIDHLLVTEPLLEAALDCAIDLDERAREHDSIKPSDHAPVVLALEA
ncbi:MAG: exodeoxyribonuclease III [Alphaproteobacteria bacterium]|nr:exodeoxyribonuclease III [Alphaproteobacteria bacterium]